MIGDDINPYPKEWDSLSAAVTRSSLLFNIYEIMNWDRGIYFGKNYPEFGNYWFFFCEDFDFSENPESMVDYYLFEDEIPSVRRFVEVFEPFADEVPDEFSFGPIDRTKINPPPIVIKRAKELYEKLLEKGDPKVEQYLK